jgi:hypothetical protein
MSRALPALCLLLVGCRYLAPAMPEYTAEHPALLANGPTGDPTRQAQPPGRPCVVECSVGFECDAPTATCVPVKSAGARDAGPAWLP